MDMQSDYPINMGDLPGPPLQFLIGAGKLVVQYAPEVARKLKDCIDRLPPEDGRIKIVRLYGESGGRVYDAYRMDGSAASTSTVYSRYIGKLFDWMADNGITKPIAEVEDEYIEFLVASRQSYKDPEGISVRRVAHFAIKKFKQLCNEEEAVSTVNPPAPPEPKPAISSEDLRSLADHVRSVCDMLILMVMNVLHMSTGASVNLRWDDFGPNFEYVTIGEGEDAKKQEIDADYRGFFSELRSRARGPYVLADSGGGLPEPVPVADRSLQYRFRRMARRSGIPLWTTLTSTRKADTIASDLLRRMFEKYLPKFDEERNAAGDASA